MIVEVEGLDQDVLLLLVRRPRIGERVEVGPVGYVEAAAGYRIEAEITPSLEVRLVGPDSGLAQPEKGGR